MGQYWLICCLDTRKCLPTDGIKLGELLFDCSTGHMTDLLAVPVPPKHSSLKFKSAATSHSPFFKLPAEIHDLVFEKLDIFDVVALSLTNGYFFNVAERHINAAYMSLLGQWAGKRLMCIGDYLDVGDEPPWFSDEDKKLLYPIKGDDEYGFTAYGIMQKLAMPVELFVGLVNKMREHLEGMNDPLLAKKEQWVDRLREIICPPLKTFYPEDQPWVLRNLTTREFVRAEAIALKKEHIHGPDIDFRGFGELVVSRICWTSDPSVSMKNTTRIHRGIWAGYRFDITTLARHEADMKNDTWKDVSEKLKKELDTIWYGEFSHETVEEFEAMLSNWDVEPVRRAEVPLWYR
ncbi:hypothetical protein DTO271D3_8658 [Paecilomyces variotii]|nr:hypothetical protein DTO271D3_8658 [Paecilomyces variotii]